MEKDPSKIIAQLGLKPHPEGGYFKETYRSVDLISKPSLDDRFSGDRNYATCIYFLLTSDSFSAFHRIQQDEIWHFYKGAPLKIHILSPEGHYSQALIGNHFDKGETPQYVVKAHDWFAVEVLAPDAFALVGCTVSPGFDFRDFELAKRDMLLDAFPKHKALITRFTRM